MEQDQGIKKKKIRRFQEVELRESEFKKASELDSEEFKNIHDEYFKRMVVYPLIFSFIAAAAFALWPSGVLYKMHERSEVVWTVLMLLVASGGAIAVVLISRCIYSLVIVSKIKKQDFWWHVGHITSRRRLWLGPGIEHYYIVDDEYCSRACFDPFYFKGTEVYFLHFPGFMRGSYMGGIVVRKKSY